jgi:hypothetical protein
MSFGAAVLLGTAIILGPTVAHAAARESFNYPVSVGIAGQNGGTGWASAWQGGSGTIDAGLNYTGLTSSGAALGPSSSYTQRSLASTIPGTTGTYVLARVLMKSPVAGTPISYGMFGLSTSTNLNVAIGDYPGTNPESANWALQFNSNHYFSQKPVTAGTSYLVVRIDFQDGNDRVRLWINPPTFVDSPLVPPDADATSGNITSITGVWWQSNVDVGMVLDEIRIDDGRQCASNLNRSAWYSFDEISGTVANDLAGANQGTLMNGAAHLTNGKSGAALVLDGTNDYVEAPASSLLDVGTGDFSFDGWLRPNTLGTTQVIFDKRVGSGSTLRGYSFFLYGSQIGVQLADSSGYSNYLSSSVSHLADGAWHHVAVSVQRNSPTGIRFYVDGVALTTTGNPTTRIASLTTSSPLRIGTRTTDTALTGWFGGAIDEIAFYRRALTPAEVAAIVTADSQGACR